MSTLPVYIWTEVFHQLNRTKDVIHLSQVCKSINRAFKLSTWYLLFQLAVQTERLLGRISTTDVQNGMFDNQFRKIKRLQRFMSAKQDHTLWKHQMQIRILNYWNTEETIQTQINFLTLLEKTSLIHRKLFINKNTLSKAKWQIDLPNETNHRNGCYDRPDRSLCSNPFSLKDHRVIFTWQRLCRGWQCFVETETSPKEHLLTEDENQTIVWKKKPDYGDTLAQELGLVVFDLLKRFLVWCIVEIECVIRHKGTPCLC